ncbi:hypothetical protein FRC17_006335 [Serendipita sp. 399]|nr:hypothetical protein FRC17_006335 [Serendipita sp. 399]
MPIQHNFLQLSTAFPAIHNIFHRILTNLGGVPLPPSVLAQEFYDGEEETYITPSSRSLSPTHPTKEQFIMFLLRRRVDSFSYQPANGVSDAVSNDSSSASATSANTLKRKADRTSSPLRPKASAPTKPMVRRLSETEKARISIYLRLFHALVAILSTVFCVVKDNSSSAVDFVKNKGIKELLYLATAVVVTAGFLTVSLALYASILLYQSLAWLLSGFLLVNVSFFSVHPHPPYSPSSRPLRARSRSPSPNGLTNDPSSSFNSMALDALPLIDLSSRSSDPGDTPPILLPEVLSPTQLAVRSLSPAFGASTNVDQNAVVESILNQPTKSSSPPPAPLSLAAILAKRKGTASLMANRPIRLREMSTVSYPDINESEGVDASDEDSTSAGQMLDNNTYQSEQDDLPNLYEDEDEEDDLQFPLPEVEPHEAPFTSSPTQVEVPLGPESIQVLDPESRKSTLDASAIMAMPEPHPHARSASESSTFAWAPPPSRVTTLASETSNDNPSDSPRDIFSPTNVSMPQPQSLNNLTFSLPFLPAGIPQPASIAAAAERPEHVQETTSSKKKDGDILEPTPYPSPPFTPPSSRPPTMYSSMSLQMPSVGDHNELDFVGPDPFAREKVRLSALVEEVKTELEAIERAAAPVHEPARIEDVVDVEPSEMAEVEPEVAPVAPSTTSGSAKPSSEPTMTVVQTEEESDAVPPAYTEVAPEQPSIQMPAPVRGILRNRSAGSIATEAAEVSPPRKISPVTSVGRGGMTTGSRINVDDLTRPGQDQTLISSPAEVQLNEVGQVVEMEDKGDESPVPVAQALGVQAMDRSGWASGADDESTAPKTKLDMRNKKKKKSKSKRPDVKKEVSFDDTPFVIGSDKEQGTTVDENETQDEERKPVIKKGRIFELALNDLSPRAASPAVLPSPSVSRAIPVPKTFEIADEEEEVPPALIPRRSDTVMSMEAVRGSPAGSPATSPAPSRRVSMLSEMMSPRSTADELSDSSSAVALAPGEFTSKQVDHYARWFARAHRDKSLPTVPMLRAQMKECSEQELAMRIKLGSRAESTKLTKSLIGEDGGKGYSSSGGSVPPIRKSSSYRRRR